MKAYCVVCGRSVRQILTDTPQGHKWVHGHCREHPTALRYSEEFARRRFAEMKAVVAQAPNRALG